MALTFTGAGTAAAASGASPQAVTTTSAFAVGDFMAVLAAFDNSGTSGADPMTGSLTVAPVTGAVGGATFSANGLNDPGVASAGVASRISYLPVKTAIPSGTVVNVGWASGTILVRVVALGKISSNLAARPVFRTASGPTNQTAVTTFTFTTPSVTAGELVLCWAAYENGSVIPTGDSDTLNGSWTTIYGLGNGSGTSGQTAVFQAKTVTATAAQAWNPTGGAASDWVTGCAIFTEVLNPVTFGISSMINQAVNRGAVR